MDPFHKARVRYFLGQAIEELASSQWSKARVDWFLANARAWLVGGTDG